MQPCPVHPSSGDNYNGISEGRQVGGEQLRPVGDRRAYFYQWTAGCQQSSYTFTPRAWYLPVSQVLMFDYIGYPDVDPIVASSRFDTGSWQVGFVRDVPTDGAVRFDDLDWHNHGDFQPVTVRDPDPTPRTLPVAAEVSVQSVRDRDGLWVYTQRTMVWLRTFAERHPKVAFHLHLTVNGVVDRIVEETYPPSVKS